MMKFAVSARTCLAAAALAALVSGCATPPPNTPGAGSGVSYTPIIDMQGVDSARYGRDLGDCRSYAASVDANSAAIGGALGGIIAGAAISAMLGGTARQNRQIANVGGFTGLSKSTDRAIDKQERILINCMTGRGYRALDGAGMISSATQLPAPTLIQLPSPVVVAPVQAPGASIAAMPVAGPGVATLASVKPAPQGQDGYNAERLSESRACNPSPKATLTNKGPGVETYTVMCSSGDSLTVRCEWGNCRALK